MSKVVTKEREFKDLFEVFRRSVYRPNWDDQDEMIINRCYALFAADYSIVDIPNRTGELSSHYPSRLIIPEFEKIHYQTGSEVIHENKFDSGSLKALMVASRLARCRCRFPVPVILYKGKFICRSSTISCSKEVYYNYMTNHKPPPTESNDSPETESAETENEEKGGTWGESVRSYDIKLLKTYRVDTIVDFMVEMEKVKYYLSVSSSEKADKDNRYADFDILSLPYPGCEFFSKFHNNSYAAEGLVFDWEQSFVDATINIPEKYNIASQLQIDWQEYKTWDLIKITQNYLKLILKHLQDGNSGLLIHCISGWDRTPLFVSLIRILLWADGIAHQSLTAIQLLYLTIAYDWYLFGHNLPDRLNKGEDIFFFCFYILKYLQSDEYSLISHRPKPKTTSGSSGGTGIIPMDGDFDGVLGIGGDSNDGRGSNWSINSNGGRISNKSHEDSMNGGNSNGINIVDFSHHNDESNGTSNSSDIEVLGTSASEIGNSPFGGLRTSPLSVPMATGGSSRQRIDSNSGGNYGSWAVITETGSLNSTADISFLNRSNGASARNDDDIDGNMIPTNMRQDRLKTLRSLFYSMYCNHIGVGNNFKNGAAGEATLGSLLGNFAEKLGGLIK